MRLIDADAVWDWYIKAFSEEHLGDRAIKPNEYRFSMHDIVGNLDNIPEIDIEQYAKEHGLFVFTKNILEQIDADVRNIKDIEVVHGALYVREFEVIKIIDKYMKGE